MPSDENTFDWSAVTARCLAYLCLRNSEYADGSVLEKARFLGKLGVPLDDRAGIIGSTPESLRELTRLATKKKGAKQNGKQRRG